MPKYARPDKMFDRFTREVVLAVFLFRCNNQVKLCLYTTCVLTSSSFSSSEECVHTRDDDLALTGSWVMEEVRLAVEKRYRILEVYKVHKYQVTQYNPETGEGGIFVE